MREKKAKVIEAARRREAAELAQAVKELCGVCTMAKKRVVNPDCSQTGGPLCAKCCKIAGGCDKYASHMITVPVEPDMNAPGYMPEEEVMCAEVYDFLGLDLLEDGNDITRDDGMDMRQPGRAVPIL
ncbi:hypothetical protein CYMTET_46971 [Cymbomonas tetramitiformis]|uniref:Uncharacterized protein n=1 Tax=Cymbomonas tetramitiformis TaxID=36881 RepID=A0AAE0BN37_9CHLO|nr:hypothetical protein CYMTET_50434 [Cymbomonas tetramitiformis]KAK3243371.1 hypothetical protein CYMTET_46971 [Cymbomonas tetramitiformis]